MKKRIFAMILAGILAVSMLSGCGGSDSSGSKKLKGKEIEMEIGWTDEPLNQFKTLVIEPFEKETGVKINLIAPGADYETVMKTRMGSGDLPDIWETHGWSLQRYSEFLLPLSKYSDIKDSMQDSAFGVIQNDEGEFYGACVTASLAGVMFNYDTLEKCGIDPYDLNRMDKFEEALQIAKDNGFIPLYIGANDTSNAAGFLNVVFPSLQTDVGCANNQVKALLDGSYDWETDGKQPFELLAKWMNNGWINENALTATTEEMQTALGKGECAFICRGINNITMARNYVPDCRVGILPNPNSGTGAPTYKVGEGTCFGVWKDTKVLDACLAWIRYVCTPEVCAIIADIGGTTPSIKDTKLEGSYAYDEYLKTAAALPAVAYDNIFDRKYFPSGMWGTMGDAACYVLDDPSEAGIEKAKEAMKEQYLLLMNGD